MQLLTSLLGTRHISVRSSAFLPSTTPFHGKWFETSHACKYLETDTAYRFHPIPAHTVVLE